MVVVVSDVEAYQLMVLAVLVLKKREHQTAELLFCTVNLEVLLTAMNCSDDGHH